MQQSAALGWCGGLTAWSVRRQVLAAVAAAEGTPAARLAGPLPGDGFTDESPAPRQPLTPAPAQGQVHGNP